MTQHETYWDTVKHVLNQEGMETHPASGNGLAVIDILEKRMSEGRVSDPADYRRLSGVYYEKGDITKAIQHGKTYAELVPNDPMGHNDLGVTYTLNGFPDEGKISLLKAITLDPTNPYIRLNMASNCEARKDREGAIENYIFFLRASEDPNNPDYYSLREYARLKFYRIVTGTPAFIPQPDGWNKATTVDPRDLQRVLTSNGLPY